MRRAVLAAAVALAIPLAAPAAAPAIVPGVIDSRWADCGQATGLVPTDIGRRQFSYGAGSALAVQPDGKLVAAGPAARGMGATRFNADGSLDTGFGTGGVAHIALPGNDRNDESQITSVAVMPDGRVVAAGWVRGTAGGSPSDPFVERFLIARFTPDGRPDTSFSGDGLVAEAPPGAASGAVESVAPAPDGSLVVAGTAEETFAVARYLDDGTADPAFGAGGVARVAPPGGSKGSAFGVSVRPDGRILAAGHTYETLGSSTWTVVRLLPGGAPDPGFGDAGRRIETFDDSSIASTLVPLGDGRFFAIGSTVDFWGSEEDGSRTRRAAIVRYTADGARDSSWAGDGSVLESLGEGLHGDVSGRAAAVDADGRLVLAFPRGGVVRYTADGARDAAFGIGGIFRLFDTSTGAIAALPDGALVLAGGNSRQSSRPAGFEFGPVVQRLAAAGAALDAARGQPAACFLRVRNPTLTHLLRGGRVAKHGKLLAGAFPLQPGGGRIVATATAGGSTFTLAKVRYTTEFATSIGIELVNRASAAKRLRNARSARISLTLTPDDADLAPVTAARTLKR